MGRPKGSKSGKKKETRKSKQGKTGYKAKISIPVRFLIDNWEARLVANTLNSRDLTQHWDPYWLTKNMLGELMEDMLANWASARLATQSLNASLPNMAAILHNLESAFSWDSYAPARHLRCDLGLRSTALSSSPSPFAVRHESFCPMAPTFGTQATSPGSTYGFGTLATSLGLGSLANSRSCGVTPSGNLASSSGVANLPRLLVSTPGKAQNLPAGFNMVQLPSNTQKGKDPPRLSFPIPSTLGPILAKRTRNEPDGGFSSFRKTSPLPIKLPVCDIRTSAKRSPVKSTMPSARDKDDDNSYSFPILEEIPSDAKALNTAG